MKYTFKKLDLYKDEPKLKRFFIKNYKTILAMIVGAIGSFAYFYYNEGQHLEAIGVREIFENTVNGAVIAILLLNSPCAKGRC